MRPLPYTRLSSTPPICSDVCSIDMCHHRSDKAAILCPHGRCHAALFFLRLGYCIDPAAEVAIIFPTDKTDALQ